MRGKRLEIRALTGAERITPAGAGKTVVWVVGLINGRDHPRRCGENPLFFHRMAARLGSPPQVRGKRVPSGVEVNNRRITPAGAGKTG